MVQMKILAGGFSTFIATYLFDSDAKTLSVASQSTTGTNPSWIVSNPKNKAILYAVNENPVGELQSLNVGDDGSVKVVNTAPTGGNGPTFSSVLSTGEVTAMNFGSPNASFIATDPNDATKFVNSPIIAFPRPEGSSNPHMSLEVNKEILVPDLGADKIWRIVSDGAPGKFKIQGQIDIDAGAGPRHIAMQGDILLTVHEKTSTLTAQQIPQGPNGTTGQLLANVSTFPANPPSGTKFAAAEIFVSPTSEKFPDPLIYVSNRNIGTTIDPAGDTIAIFQMTGAGAQAPAGQNNTSSAPARRRFHARDFHSRQAGGVELKLIAQVPTGLQQIRSMALGPVENGGDEFIIAGANTNGGVSMFQRVDGGKNLTLVANNQDIANRTSFVFL